MGSRGRETTVFGLTTTAAGSSALGVSGGASASVGARRARDDNLGGLLAGGLAGLLADWSALQDGGRLLAGVHARVLALVLAAVVRLLQDDDLLVVVSARGSRAAVALRLALVGAGAGADWGRAGGLALVGAGRAAGVTLLSDDDDWSLVGGAGAGAGWHALWGAGWLAGLLAGRLAGREADWGRAGGRALVVAGRRAAVVVLDDDDLLVVVVVSAGWSTSRLAVAGGARGLAGRLALAALVLLWQDDDLWLRVTARVGASGLAGLDAGRGRARAVAGLLALVAGAALWHQDDLVVVSAALLLAGWSTLAGARAGLARRLTLLDAHREALKGRARRRAAARRA